MSTPVRALSVSLWGGRAHTHTSLPFWPIFHPFIPRCEVMDAQKGSPMSHSRVYTYSTVLLKTVSDELCSADICKPCFCIAWLTSSAVRFLCARHSSHLPPARPLSNCCTQKTDTGLFAHISPAPQILITPMAACLPHRLYGRRRPARQQWGMAAAGRHRAKPLMVQMESPQ